MSDETAIPDDRELLREIGQILVDLAPPEAEAMVFRGRIYPGFAQGMPGWVDAAGNETSFGEMDAELPSDSVLAILERAEALKRTPPFANAPFTHFEYRIDRNNEVGLDLAHIPEAQTWNNLYMRRIGELSREEAEDLSIPEADWRRAVEALAAGGD
ncbi:hypothetical protein LNKW23_18750 [Paralimibaculum aggregatum]|uniref:Uncharacterized protein n=1 Tax=Paralimibaculum aggregatum TaxID=3036245 RepID=A0ABQ6LI47_9RHOB|nr:hypothetical protein [Limibaculum sp. NKW23]GMG82662.1 hypothetical protein LNKW23_18750 [Limibaculum sp. NKW23]